MARPPAFTPFAARGRGAIAAILLTFALFSALGIVLSLRATQRSKHRAIVTEVAVRQRTLSERYVQELLLARAGEPANPAATAALLAQSADALLDGGRAPAVAGDDDAVALRATRGSVARRQLEQERRLVHDLTTAGAAFLAGKPLDRVPQTAHEHVAVTDPVERLRVLAALTSSVSLNAARTIATQTDRNISGAIVLQALLGGAGLLLALAFGFGLLTATRRQTVHFRTLVQSSTDLVLIFGPEGCRYASQSVTEMLDKREDELLGGGLAELVHPDERDIFVHVTERAEPDELVFRLQNRFGNWRSLEARVSDLRGDRHVRGVVLNARDVTERFQLEAELFRQALHDRLTGLANRALFRDRVDHALARSARSAQSIAVLLVDLDGFKQVNDSLGHDAGDELLRQVASRFGEVIRAGDTLARLGGDEFAILLDGAKEAAAVTVANRLLERLREPVDVAGRQLPLDASIGIVVHEDGRDRSDDLLRHADLAMYAAKEAGRGRYELFRYDMARELGELIGLEHDLRLGLERGEFDVHYQPEVDLVTHELVGVEALARWRSPTRGLVAAERFIGVAETTGLIGELGVFVLREACLQTVSWRESGVLPDGFVTWVNLSGKQLSAGGVNRLVQQTLAETGLPSRLLGLEVTETAIVLDGAPGERALAELEELHDLGVRIAIDDFGTGFSSLSHLRQFPVDVLKVDRSFVQGVDGDSRDAAITGHLARLAHALGLLAVAEGIESPTQLASVRELGCDIAQGHLFAPALAPEELTRLLHAGAVVAPPLRASA
jgi:diguanylate cyclase (GGDEF)-like protein/PAS domain S-box-containing protein